MGGWWREMEGAIGAIQSIKFNYEVAARANKLTGRNRRNYTRPRQVGWPKIDLPRAAGRCSRSIFPNSFSIGRSTAASKRSTRPEEGSMREPRAN